MVLSHRSLAAIFVLGAFVSVTTAQKLKADEIVAKHLESIASDSIRAGAKTLVAGGTGTAMFTIRKDITLKGQLILASDSPKSLLEIKLNSPEYRGENFAFDSKKVSVGYANLGSRSFLGNFVEANSYLVSEGLLGGTLLGRSWALERLTANKPKLSGGGIKKIDGKEYYAVEYLKKGGSDLTIILFFDKTTFRHVRTEYKRIASGGIGISNTASARISEGRYLLVEEFDDFQVESGMTLPRSYRIAYTETGGQGAVGMEWKFLLNDYAINAKLEQNTFESVKE